MKTLFGGGLRRQVALQVDKLCREFDAKALVFALHGLPLAQAHDLVREIVQGAGCCVVAEYRLAERNLDLPAVALGHTLECLSGRAHYAHYKAFMAAGALEGFARKAGFAVCARHRVLGGAATVAAFKLAE